MPDITKPFTDIKCKECRDTFILNDNDICISNLELQKPTCTSTQALYLTSDKKWECKDCPAGCTGCDLRTDGNFSCFGCDTGFYFKKFETYRICE